MNLIKTLIAGGIMSASLSAFAGPVNINTASPAELDLELHGVGPTIAQRIVDYRQAKGPFTSAEQLVEVKGIGSKTLARNGDNIRLD